MNPIVYDYGISQVRDKEVRELIRVGPDRPLFTTKCLRLRDGGPHLIDWGTPSVKTRPGRVKAPGLEVCVK